VLVTLAPEALRPVAQLFGFRQPAQTVERLEAAARRRAGCRHRRIVEAFTVHGVGAGADLSLRDVRALARLGLATVTVTETRLAPGAVAR
jgi:hypothetical protein